MDKAEDVPRKPSRSRNTARNRGSIYDRIARARETRDRVLAEREPQPDSNVEEASIERDNPAAKADAEPQQSSPVASANADRARRRSAPLWALSVLIAAAGVGVVLWGSRPAGTTLVDIVPTVALRPVAPITVSEPASLERQPSPASLEAPSLSIGSWTPPSRISLGQFPQAAVLNAGPFIAEPEALTNEASYASFVAPNLPESAWIPPKRISFGKPMQTLTPSPGPLIPEPASTDVINLRVSLNAPTTVSDESLAAVIAALSESGAEPEPNRVNMTISSSNVRYYHPTDQDAAQVIAMGIGAELRDFTDYEPSPPEGLVEIWLAGEEIRQGPPPRRSALQEGFDQFARDLRNLEIGLRRVLRGEN